MMKKMMGILLALCLIFASASSAQAATADITLTVTTTKSVGTYSYGTGGNRLKIEVTAKEKHPTTGDVYNDSINKTVNGAYTSVTVTLNAAEGYKIKNSSAYGYLNGTLEAELLKVEP